MIEFIKLVVTKKTQIDHIFFKNQHIKINVQNVYGEDCKEKARLRLSELVPRGGVPLPFLLCTFAHSYFEYIVKKNIRISYFYIHFEYLLKFVYIPSRCIFSILHFQTIIFFNSTYFHFKQSFSQIHCLGIPK